MPVAAKELRVNAPRLERIKEVRRSVEVANDDG